MNPTAIYSKSGKGVQEASGKTSHLSRPDRAVLSAIDGRATLADVAQKVGKTFDPAFEKLIESLDKGGFVREVSPGVAAPAKPGAAPAKSGAAKAGGTAPMEAASDLDFTAALSVPKAKAPPPKPAPPPPPSAAEKAQAEKSAKEQQDAMAKAREEAERKATAERDRLKAEAEAKVRAETEAKLRADAESKAKADAEKKLAADAEAKVKAAREAAAKVAAEAKAKAEAEARKVREAAEAEAKKAREEADRVRREQEELKRKLEEERKAREEAERKAKEEARRLEEERKKLEEERKREEAERAARRKREEEEEQARRKKREEEEEERERQRAAERKKREQEEEERERSEKAMRDARRKAQQREEEQAEERERAERKAKAQEEPQEEEKPRPTKEKAPEPEAAKPAAGGGFADSLMADLESFTNREEEERKAEEEAARKKKEEAAQRAREAEERRQKEEAEREEREEKERRKREEKERKAKEEAELREREEKEKQRLKDEEEKRKKEAAEREKKAKQDEALTAKATGGGAAYDEVQRRSKRERELQAKPRAGAAAASRAERRGGLGKTIGLGLVVLLAAAVGVAHVMPIDTSDYERAATDAIGRPVKISSARLSLTGGLQVKLTGVAIGDDVKIAEVRTSPSMDSVLGPKKVFSRIEVDGIRIEQHAVGGALFAPLKADNFSTGRIVVRQIELTGPLAVPKGLEVEVIYDAAGAVRSVLVRGPEALAARLTPKGSSAEVDMTASSFTLPFAPDISLSKFSLKGTATPQGLSVAEWDGALLNGTLSGTANVRWGDSWNVDGVVTARNINAAVFAPALLSDGKGEGSGKFSMRGQPGKLAGRLDGSFTVSRGVLGSIDLSRAIQTQGKQATGRTQFNELNGQATYDRGAVSLRNVTLSAGALNAGASAEIAANGALSGRIVADVKVSSQTQRATLNLGGTVKEPQVRN